MKVLRYEIRKARLILPIAFWGLIAAMAAGQSIQPVGGGEFVFEYDGQCFSPAQRDSLKHTIKANLRQLSREGKLKNNTRRSMPTFELPIQQTGGLGYNNFYGLSNFVDQNTGGGIQDYNCGSRAYNGHLGTDYFTWPFPWHMVENDLAEVIAAEDGIIVDKIDGYPDDHCSCINYLWNAVAVMHSDGSLAIYGHMKTGTVTSKAIGESVTTGEFLGVIASSGCSTGPHLHFEVWTDTNFVQLVDPYAGPCNDLNNDSWWVIQQDYREPTINALLTHDAVPQQGCPGSNENPHRSDTFATGESIYTVSYFRDQLRGSMTAFRLRKPDSTVYSNWNFTSPGTYNASWWYWVWNLPADGPFGTWTFEGDYGGETVVHKFVYRDPDCVNPGTNTWVGPAVGNWNDSDANWSRGFIPKKCDNVLIPDGYEVYVLNGNTAECYTLEVEENAIFEVEDGALLDVQVEE